MRDRVPAPLAWLVVMLGLFGTSVAAGMLTHSPPHDSQQSGTADETTLSRSTPVRVTIPTIGVNAGVQPVGLAADGSISPPSQDQTRTAGWYAASPAPGENGPAILVGHYDDRRGPAVFYRLDALRPGDMIEVTRRDRRVARFWVESVRRYPKTGLPLGPVYADYSGPGLRLITCGGTWVDRKTGYADNVIVFASAAPA